MKKYLLEFIGTLVLVLVGCGAAVISGDDLGALGIGFAFGLTLLVLFYSIGPVSGCHINPAVSLGYFAAGRLSGRDFLGYVTAQFLGGIFGAVLLYGILRGQFAGYEATAQGLAQNGWGVSYLGQFRLSSALLFEFVATLLFVRVILAVTQEDFQAKAMAGVVIGLTLAILHLLGFQITGVSVNPARSLGPALLVGGNALAQVWMFLVIPSLAGTISGLLDRLALVDRWERVGMRRWSAQP